MRRWAGSDRGVRMAKIYSTHLLSVRKRLFFQTRRRRAVELLPDWLWQTEQGRKQINRPHTSGG